MVKTRLFIHIRDRQYKSSKKKYWQCTYVWHVRGRFNIHTVCNLYMTLVMTICGMEVMKMENIAPGAGFEPTLWGFLASVLTIRPPRLPGISMLCVPICMWLII